MAAHNVPCPVQSDGLDLSSLGSGYLKETVSFIPSLHMHIILLGAGGGSTGSAICYRSAVGGHLGLSLLGGGPTPLEFFPP